MTSPFFRNVRKSDTNENDAIVQALRSSTSEAMPDDKAVLSAARKLFGKTDKQSISLVVNAYRSYVQKNGPKAFSRLSAEGTNDREGKLAHGASPYPDAPGISRSPSELNSPSRPDTQSPDPQSGNDAPERALAETSEGEEGGERYNEQVARQAKEAGGQDTNIGIKDQTIDDEGAQVHADDVGNATGGATARKKGKPIHLWRGKGGAIYQITQNGNYRRISKKELMERQLYLADHHSIADPDNPKGGEGSDPHMRHGYAHTHEAESLGYKKFSPESVEGGVDGMEDSDANLYHAATDPESKRKEEESKQENLQREKANNVEIGGEIPSGHVNGNDDLTPGDLLSHLHKLAEFKTPGGEAGYRLAWIEKPEKGSFQGKDGSSLSTIHKPGTGHMIDFDMNRHSDGSVTITPKDVSYALKNGKFTAGSMAGAMHSGALHPGKVDTQPTESKKLAPITITKEQMQSGNLQSLNTLLADLAHYSHRQRGTEVNTEMMKQDEGHQAHPRHLFDGMKRKKAASRSGGALDRVLKKAGRAGFESDTNLTPKGMHSVVPFEATPGSTLSDPASDAIRHAPLDVRHDHMHQFIEDNHDLIHAAAHAHGLDLNGADSNGGYAGNVNANHYFVATPSAGAQFDDPEHFHQSARAFGSLLSHAAKQDALVTHTSDPNGDKRSMVVPHGGPLLEHEGSELSRQLADLHENLGYTQVPYSHGIVVHNTTQNSEGKDEVDDHSIHHLVRGYLNTLPAARPDTPTEHTRGHITYDPQDWGEDPTGGEYNRLRGLLPNHPENVDPSRIYHNGATPEQAQALGNQLSSNFQRHTENFANNMRKSRSASAFLLGPTRRIEETHYSLFAHMRDGRHLSVVKSVGLPLVDPYYGEGWQDVASTSRDGITSPMLRRRGTSADDFSIETPSSRGKTKQPDAIDRNRTAANRPLPVARETPVVNGGVDSTQDEAISPTLRGRGNRSAAMVHRTLHAIEPDGDWDSVVSGHDWIVARIRGRDVHAMGKGDPILIQMHMHAIRCGREITKPIVLKHEDGYHIIHGEEALIAAMRSGHETIPAYCGKPKQ